VKRIADGPQSARSEVWNSIEESAVRILRRPLICDSMVGNSLHGGGFTHPSIKVRHQPRSAIIVRPRPTPYDTIRRCFMRRRVFNVDCKLYIR